MKFHYATVIENNDPKLLGRVQIKVESLMDGFTDDMCPWATSFLFSMGGMTVADTAAPYGSLKVPRVGSLVWVFFADEKNQKHPFYLADVTLDAMRISQTIFLEAAKVIMNTWLLSPSDIDGTYPNLHYTLYPSGMIIGIGIDSKKEMFIYHSPTTFVSINDSGAINVAGSDIIIGGSNSTTMSTLSNSAITMDATNVTISNVTGGLIEVTPTDVNVQNSSGATINVTATETTVANAGGTGTISMDAAGNVTIKGLTVQIDGTANVVAPSGSGGLCALPACLFTGAPHVGNKIT